MESLQPHSWTLRFETHEDEDHCDMVVHLGTRVTGRCPGTDDPVGIPRTILSQVGEELAAARALQDLARHLTEDAWTMIESHPASTG